MQTFNTGDTINDFAMNLQGSNSARSEQDSKHRRSYARLQGCYLGNRVSDDSLPLPAYELAVTDWALKSKANMHEHCKTLLQAVANPMMLEPSLAELLPKLRLSPDEHEMLACSSGKWDWLRGWCNFLSVLSIC
ncbi:hypothetical protein N9B39_02030 [bacterium]|nr:hypothetical protein [bacterium]